MSTTRPDPAPDVSDANGVREVRRYANRKLYDVRASAYVALEDLAAIVRAGETVRVIDVASGEDITAQTLVQVILDEGKRGPSLLPSDLLHAALRKGGQALDAGRHTVDAMRHGVDELVIHSLGRLGRALPGARPSTRVATRATELDALKRQLAEVERTLAALVARQGAAPAPASVPSHHPSAPDRVDPTNSQHQEPHDA